MGATRELEDLRRRIAGRPRNRQGHRQYDSALKEAVRQYARRRLREGGTTLHGVAGELAISADTLWSWVNRIAERRESREPPSPVQAEGASEVKAPDPAQRFRSVVAALGSRTRTTPYPAEVRAKALEYAKERQAAGATMRVITRELGLGADTLRKWMKGEHGQHSPAVRRVAITSRLARSAKATGKIVVHGPGGVRIEGLDVDDIAALLKGLSC